jgi:hypothetical protein
MFLSSLGWRNVAPSIVRLLLIALRAEASSPH